MLTEAPRVSPLKFLDAYTASDADHFFGRQAEQRRLVELIFSSRLVLVYGASGTGKSSLVQCGLTQALSLSDYFPVIIRRRGDFNTTLVKTLTDVLPEAESQDPVELVTSLARMALRPVYLIFDQFEELFISGTTDEQQQLIANFLALYDSRVPCKLIVLIREEYIAWLNDFEEKLPQLFDLRLRVEAMSERNLDEVIIRTFQALDNVQLNEPKETAQAIIQNIQLNRVTFQLPYLQVYLDRLWQMGEDRRLETGSLKIIIDPALVASVGEIENVLETFLREQKEACILALDDGNNDIRIALDKILESFVTYEGTRREQTMLRLVAETGLADRTVWAIVNWLENGRLIREYESTYELPHDCLALVIDRGRSAIQRHLNDTLRRLKEAYFEYAATPGDDFLLPARRLAEVRELEVHLREDLARNLPDEYDKIWSYIDQSEQFQKAKYDEEFRRQEQRFLKKQNRRIRLILVLGTALLLVIGFSKYAWNMGNQSKALFLASESDELQSAQALRLLEVAADLFGNYPGSNAHTFIYKRLFKRFNESDSLRFNQLDLIHSEEVKSAHYSPDGQHIVTASDSTVIVWHLDGNPRDMLPHNGYISSASFSPDSHHIIIVSGDTKSVWDFYGKRITTHLNQNPIDSANYSPDRCHYVINSNNTVNVWDIKRKLLADLTHQSFVKSVSFSPDSRHVVTVSENMARVWDINGALINTLIHQGKVNSAEYSPDSRHIVTASGKIAKVWDIKENLQAKLSHRGSVNIADYLPGRCYPINNSDDGDTARILDISTKVRAVLIPQYNNHYQYTLDEAYFSPDGLYILTTSVDGMGNGKIAHIWDVNGNLLVTLPKPVKSAWLSSDGYHIVATLMDGTERLWYTPEGALQWLKENNDKVAPLSQENRIKYEISDPFAVRDWIVQKIKSLL